MIEKQIWKTHNTIADVFTLLFNCNSMISLRASLGTDASAHGGPKALRTELAFIEVQPLDDARIAQAADGLVAGEVLRQWLEEFDKSPRKAVLSITAKKSANSEPKNDRRGNPWSDRKKEEDKKAGKDAKGRGEIAEGSVTCGSCQFRSSPVDSAWSKNQVEARAATCVQSRGASLRGDEAAAGMVGRGEGVDAAERIAEKFAASEVATTYNSDGMFDAEMGALLREYVQWVLNRLGLQRNLKKGQWDPVQVIEHLGLKVDLKQGQFRVTERRVQKIHAKVKELSCDAAQNWRIWRCLTRAKICTDASLQAWGGMLNLKEPTRGFWPDEMRSLHITHFELEAVYKTIQAFLRGKLGPTHMVNRFVSEILAQLPRYSAPWKDPCCEGVDSLAYDWRGEINWVNPPWALPDKVAHKLREEGAAATVVASY
ncbi:hypothetical protein CYMTET_25410 [Cymbomonas tetramitiformis]|uniref:Uncharacterized protein n=1 Tax=Cymbomonas tetramitiformis TaxID=36881 RepID=A0AAE0FTX6_9CHLO|nr:hypothetical protein CYMTET_25410 [Cymbomonas tetramitiformis]